MRRAAMNDPGCEPDRQPATVADRLAREIKCRRIAAGLSQRVLATQIGYSRQYVSMTEWEDANLPSLDLVTAIDTVLGAGGALIAMRTQASRGSSSTRTQSPAATTDSEVLSMGVGAESVVHDGLRRQPPLDQHAIVATWTGSNIVVPPGFSEIGPTVLDPVESLVHSRKISNRTITSFTAVTRLLASQRQSIAPDALVGLIAAHRDSVAELFRAADEDHVKERLGALLGETSIVASRLWSAVGDRPMALANCVYARRLADKLRNPLLGGIARIFESNLRSDAATLIGADGDIVIGLRMLREAAVFGDVLPPAARARIAAEQAQAYAVLELPRECRDTLALAHRAVDEIDEPDRTGLFSDWNTARLHVYEGTCWLFLDKPRKAIAALQAALRATREGDRNVALAAQVDLASAYVLDGELEEGCLLIGETYESLTAMGNQRGIERAQRAVERLAPWTAERPVRELEQRIAALTAQ
ncbi:helix-turn-helix domain-containing protein [Nocardia sp. CA-151230]|uniref:helix-turn-helix domain-containing protein n=1 Tax=Nocardia sp. CA-151230 TaxID=3239982 RepID=UPI003D8A369E